MVTLKSLAKELNVSVSTVSKALNNNPEISQRTIERVKELAEFYNYHPNKMALSLRKSQTKTIGVVIPSSLNRFFAKVLFAIEKEASKHSYHIITCISNESLEKEIESIGVLANGSVDGFIVALSEETQVKSEFNHFDTIKNKAIPLVLFDRVSNAIECDKVVIDDFKAISEATSHLINIGRKHIAFISAIDDLSVGELRKQGYKQAFAEANLSVNDELTLVIDSHTDTQKQMKIFFENHPQIDGIIAADNISGTMSIGLANQLGIAIPKDLSVIGFADEDVSNLTFPKLAIVDQNAETIGKKAFQLMLNRITKISKTNQFHTEIVSTELKEKESLQ